MAPRAAPHEQRPDAPPSRVRRLAAPLLASALAAVLTFGVVAAVDDQDSAPTPAKPAQEAAGQAAFTRMACGSCHTLAAAGARGQVGPNLDDRLPSYDAASLKAKIADPYRGRGANSIDAMPQDFGKRLSNRELDALVLFLLAARGEVSPAQ